MKIEKEVFNIDVLDPDLKFVQGVLQLLSDETVNMGIYALNEDSLFFILSEAETRCRRVMGMFRDGQGSELQKFYNEAHPEEARDNSVEKDEALECLDKIFRENQQKKVNETLRMLKAYAR